MTRKNPRIVLPPGIALTEPRPHRFRDAAFLSIGAVTLAIAFLLIKRTKRYPFERILEWTDVVAHWEVVLAGLAVAFVACLVWIPPRQLVVTGCPSCGSIIKGLTIGGPCPSCGQSVEPIYGFFFRHPEHAKED